MLLFKDTSFRFHYKVHFKTINYNLLAYREIKWNIIHIRNEIYYLVIFFAVSFLSYWEYQSFLCCCCFFVSITSFLFCLYLYNFQVFFILDGISNWNRHLLIKGRNEKTFVNCAGFKIVFYGERLLWICCHKIVLLMMTYNGIFHINLIMFKRLEKM